LKTSNEFQNLTDEELVEKIVNTKNDILFGILYERYSHLVYNKCYGFTKTRVEAEDLTQDVFVKLFQKLSSFQGKAKFSKWLSNSKLFSLQLNNASKGKLNLRTINTAMVLNDNSVLKGSLPVDNLDLILNKKADMNIEGNCDNLNLIISGSSDINAKKSLATNINLNASNSSDIYVRASKLLSLYAKGQSNVYVYGNPEIKVKGLNDKSQIIKK